jgi:hypothetical protein
MVDPPSGDHTELAIEMPLTVLGLPSIQELGSEKYTCIKGRAATLDA